MKRHLHSVLLSLALACVGVVAVEAPATAAGNPIILPAPNVVGSACAGSAGLLILGNSDGRRELVWLGTSTTWNYDGTVYHKYEQLDGSWSGAVSMGLHGYGGLAGARNADGRLEVFTRDGDDQLRHDWQDSKSSGGWSGWASLGGSLSSAPGCVGLNSYGGIRIAVTGTDVPTPLRHEIYQTAPSCCWSAWVWPGDGAK
ncbi:hypothetical protein [Hamadaea tsunoensis]|uniref:hypothetical protein n=1 Tax=Hamadaea tsunoensis TaxID=53368 RepID=UPI00040FB00F|nr:hypothetical protein [Hamadaea tsunoensis]